MLPPLLVLLLASVGYPFLFPSLFASLYSSVLDREGRYGSINVREVCLYLGEVSRAWRVETAREAS